MMMAQDDGNKTQRSQELDYKKSLCEYSWKRGWPGQIKKIPADEKFSTEYFLVS